MCILVLLPSLLDSVGGIQTYSQALVSALSAIAARKGWEIEVLALHDRRPGGDDSGAESRWPSVIIRGFEASKTRFSIAAVQAASRADVVVMGHVHFAPLVHFMRWVAPHAEYRVAAHGIEVWKAFGPLMRSALRRAGMIWPVSDHTRRRMLQENPGLSSLRYDLLPNTLNPAETPFKRHSRPELGLPPGKLLLCVSRMSRLEPYKNIDRLIRAFSLVRRQLTDATLVLVGPGDDRPRLEGIVRELNLDDGVVFAGRVADELLPSYFAECDAFALPSTGEGFGIVYLEAMFHAKACIGADAGGVPEVIEHNVTGLLVDPADPAQLPAAIVRVLQDDARRSAMGLAGRQRLEQRFSFAHFRDRLEVLLAPSSG